MPKYEFENIKGEKRTETVSITEYQELKKKLEKQGYKRIIGKVALGKMQGGSSIW